MMLTGEMRANPDIYPPIDRMGPTLLDQLLIALLILQLTLVEVALSLSHIQSNVLSSDS
jgi:hypothetical protein